MTQLTRDSADKGRDLATDGPRVYFAEEVDGHSVLAEVSSSGGEVGHVAVDLPNIVINDTAPSRSEVLVQSYGVSEGTLVSENQSAFWAVPVPAGSPRRLGNIVGHANGGAWSRDGEQFTYGRGHDLYVAKGDGGNGRKIATVKGWPRYPRFSPDGRQVRFSDFSETGDSVVIWEVPSTGGQLHRVLESMGNVIGAGDWSADGRYYFFSGLPG
jgi:hypothetical protein